MKDGTQQGIREVRRNDREKESLREVNTPSFVASSCLSFFPQAANCCFSRLGKAEMEQERYTKKFKKGGEWAGDGAQQTVYPPK